MTDPQRPAVKHPRGACYFAVRRACRTEAIDFADRVARITDADNARQWLGKLNDMDAPTDYKEIVAARYRALTE